MSFLEPQGPVAAAQRTHLIEVVLLVLIAVLPVFVLVPWVAWHYRLRKGPAGGPAPRYRPKWSFSWRLELAAWGIPILIVAALAVLLLCNARALDPYKPIAASNGAAHATTHVQVVAYNWKWLFLYPDQGIATVGELAFPAGQPLALEMTSATVMQSLQIPALGSQMYVMGGMVTHLNLLADQPGEFLGENTLFNGRGFHQQQFQAVSMSPIKFDAWVKTVRARGAALDAPMQRKIAAPSTMAELHVALADPASAPTSPVYLASFPPGYFRQVLDSTVHGTTTDATLAKANP